MDALTASLIVIAYFMIGKVVSYFWPEDDFTALYILMWPICVTGHLISRLYDRLRMFWI